VFCFLFLVFFICLKSGVGNFFWGGWYSCSFDFVGGGEIFFVSFYVFLFGGGCSF